jgi:hypothetical protein
MYLTIRLSWAYFGTSCTYLLKYFVHYFANKNSFKAQNTKILGLRSQKTHYLTLKFSMSLVKEEHY